MTGLFAMTGPMVITGHQQYGVDDLHPQLHNATLPQLGDEEWPSSDDQTA